MFVLSRFFKQCCIFHLVAVSKLLRRMFLCDWHRFIYLPREILGQYPFITVTEKRADDFWHSLHQCPQWLLLVCVYGHRPWQRPPEGKKKNLLRTTRCSAKWSEATSFFTVFSECRRCSIPGRLTLPHQCLCQVSGELFHTSVIYQN